MRAALRLPTIVGMDLSTFVPLLGHPRVLEASAEDPRRRVVIRDGEAITGVAAYEPLYGPRAEGVVAIRQDASDATLPFLVDALLDLTHAAGLRAVRFVFGSAEQHWRAERLRCIHDDCSVRRDWVDVRLHGDPRSVALL